MRTFVLRICCTFLIGGSAFAADKKAADKKVVVKKETSEKKTIPSDKAVKPSETPKSKKPGQKKQQVKKMKAAKKMEMSELSKSLQGKLILQTSAGLAGFVGTDATVGGAADISVLYDLGFQVLGKTFGSYRYLPLAVTLQEKLSDSRTVEYTGVIEGQLFGVQTYLLETQGMCAYLTGELGVLKQGLHEPTTGKSKEDVATQLFAGAGVEWPMEKEFKLGAKLSLGVGTYTVWQLAGGASLAF